MSAGYSPRSLAKKLGIKPGLRIALVGAPPGYGAALGELPAGCEIVPAGDALLDLVQTFVTGRAELESTFPALKAGLREAGALWVSWPKRASGVQTDLSENAVREVGLQNGLVDMKVISVDEVWSALKFVYRLRDRQALDRQGR